MELSNYVKLFMEQTQKELDEFQKFIDKSSLSNPDFSYAKWQAQHAKWHRLEKKKTLLDFPEIEIYLNDD